MSAVPVFNDDRFTVARPASEADWLALRKPYSNASTAAVHMREHEHLSIGDWYVEKVTGATQDETRPMTRGRKLERPIAQWYSDEHPQYGPFSPFEVMFGRGHLLFTPDFEFSYMNAGLEVKATPGRTSQRSRYWQCVAGLACSPWDEVHLVELHAGDYIPTVLRRDDCEADIDRLLEAVERDWSYVEFGMVPPDAVLSDENVIALWPKGEPGKSVELGPTPAHAELARQLVEHLRDARADGEASKKDAARLRASIAELMGDAEVALVEGLPVVTFKNNRDSTVVDWAGLERDHPDLVARYTGTKPGSRVMRVVA